MIYGKPFKIQASPIWSFISLQIKRLAVFARESRIFGEKKNENSHSAILKFWHTLRYQKYNWIR